MALGRVSSRAELRNIRLVEVSARCDPKTGGGTLEANLDNDCEVVGRESKTLQVACNYRFSVNATQAKAAEATVKYLLDYELGGDEPFAAEDIEEFAFANGTLHSWPFVREFLYGLTSKMGFPPYMLPAFHFKPKPPQIQPTEEKLAGTPEPAAAPSPEEAK